MTAPTGRPIFVIGVGNTGMHVYRDASSLVDAREIHTGNAGSFEFYDVHGRRLTPEFGPGGALTGLRDAGAPPDPATVQTKLCEVRKRLAESVDDRLAKSGAGYTRDQALRYLPELTGKQLPDCYVLLETTFGHTSGGGAHLRHDGSWWHNFWAH